MKSLLLLVAASFLGFSTLVSAQTYPNRPVKVISPFPPGGSVDTVARFLAPRLSEALGQQVLVENRSGASGNIGTEMVVRSPADGYTLLINTTPLVSNAHLYPKMSYDSLVDFVPISLLCQSQSVLAVHPKVAAKSIKELLDLARSNPGKLNFATAGPATNPHIGGEFFNYLGKVEMTAIHYKGGGPALLGTLAGDVDVVVSGISEVMPHALAGKVRALGATGLKRSPAFPDLPTIAESGLPGYEFTTWHALLAPKGTPPAVIALLNDRVKKALATPEAVKQFTASGLEIIASTPEHLGAHLKEESVKWGRVIKERGLKLD